MPNPVKPSINKKDTEFKVPPAKKRLRSSASASNVEVARSSSTSNITLKNSFEVLSNADPDDDMSSSSFGSRPNSNRQHRPALNINKSKSVSKSTKPVFVDCNYNVAVNFIKTVQLKAPPLLKIINAKSMQIICGDREDKAKLISSLTDKQFKFHTFAEPADRDFTFILSGYHKDTNDAILAEIKAEGLEPLRVSLMSEKFEKPVYLVHFARGATNINTLQHNYPTVNRVLIHWSKIDQTRKAPTQCNRCQIWGHSARNCGRDFRCVKCTSTHAPGKDNCERKTREGTAKCVNCGGDHPANHRECEAFLRYQAKNIRRRMPAQRQFVSSPAPWANPSQNSVRYREDFPPLTKMNNQKSSNIQKPVSFTQIPTSSKSIPLPHRVDKSGANNINFADAHAAFWEIPDINETLTQFIALTNELSACMDHGQRISIILRYCARNPIHNAP